MVSKRGCWGAALLLLMLAPVAGAQRSPQEMADILLTDVSAESATFALGTRIYSEEATDFRRRRFKMASTDLDLNVPIHMPNITDRILSFQVKVGMRDFGTPALLPNTISEFPDPLFDVGLGVTYKWNTPGHWKLGYNFSVMAPSDDPFDSKNDVRVGANLFARTPSGDRDEWLFYVHYLSTRDYLHDVPLPGAAYIWKPTPKYTFVIGAPLAMMDLRFNEKTYWKTSYLLLRKLSTEAGRNLTKEIVQFVGFDWDQQDYYRSSNKDLDDKLTYHEKRVTGGFRYTLSPGTSFELAGGYAFQRFWYEGLDYGDRHYNRLNIDDGGFAQARLNMAF